MAKELQVLTENPLQQGLKLFVIAVSSLAKTRLNGKSTTTRIETTVTNLRRNTGRICLNGKSTTTRIETKSMSFYGNSIYFCLNGKSTTTRIETPESKTAVSIVSFVLTENPLQQGLKHSKTGASFSAHKCLNGKSTTTRIETRFPAELDVVYQYGLNGKSTTTRIETKCTKNCCY